MRIRREYLKLIACGVKTVEVRVGYPGMRRIQPGQEMAFVSGDLRVPTVVKRVTEYATVDAMLDSEDPRSIGGALGESRDELLAVIRSIYPAAKEQLGILAMEMQVAGQALGAPRRRRAPSASGLTGRITCWYARQPSPDDAPVARSRGRRWYSWNFRSGLLAGCGARPGSARE